MPSKIVEHGTTAVVAIVIAMAGARYLQPAPPPDHPPGKVVVIPQGSGPMNLETAIALSKPAMKYTWGELSKAEQTEAAKLIGNLDRREVEIFCGIPACGDLAEDIDEVMDMTGAASTVRRPVMDLGGGVGIMPPDDQARKIAAAIKQATAGRVDLKVLDTPYPGGGIAIALGRAPRK